MDLNNMTMSDKVDLTVGCCYEGFPVPFSRVMEYTPCTADDVTRAVREGRARFVRRVVGPGGQLLHGTSSLFLVPSWADE